MNTRIRISAACLCVTALVTGCAAEAHDRGAARAVEGASSLDEALDPGVLTAPGPWTVEATGGARVTLDLEGGPAVGPVRARIGVSGPDGPRGAHSVDLVSPTMPLHGLVRFPVVDGVGAVEIPMEGQWALYVNLDAAGEDHAVFVLDVEPAAGGAHDRSSGS